MDGAGVSNKLFSQSVLTTAQLMQIIFRKNRNNELQF